MENLEKKETIKVEVVAGVVIKKDNKYLLIQENRPADSAVHEKWNLPAGRVDKGETLEEAAIRETKEESGYDVELINKIAIFHKTANDVVKHVFEAKIINKEPQETDNEILDKKWFTFEEIMNMKDKLRNEWVINSINLIKK